MSVVLAVLAVALSLGVSVVTGPGGSPAVAATAQACARSLKGSTLATAGQSASARPVVLVHGWTGRPLTGTASQLKAALGGKISTFTFDYSKWAADWPTNANIAPCLAYYVNQVSAAYKDVGGDRKVILVAHSMGGVAIRYASSETYVQDPITADVAPLIITLDTPHLGSPWGDTPLALGKQLWGGVLGNSIPNPFGTDGSVCLQPHDKGQRLPSQCGELPPWLPGGTTLDQVGGNITIRRTLLGVHLYDIDTGSDGIVKTTSSVGYRTSGPEGTAPEVSSPTTGTTLHSQYVDCAVTTGQIHNLLNARGGAFSSAVSAVGVGELTDWAVLQDIQNGQDTTPTLLYAAAAMLTAGCGHTHITTDADAISQVVTDINTYLKARPASSGLTGTTWVGTDQFFQLIRVKFASNGTASISTLQPGGVEFKPMDCMGTCQYKWKVADDHVTVTAADNIWTWSAAFSKTSINGVATYIRGAKHSFSLTPMTASSCPSTVNVQSSQGGSAKISRLNFACFDGFAAIVFDLQLPGWSTANTMVTVWKQAGTAWSMVDRAKSCPNGTLPKWIVDGACQVG